MADFIHKMRIAAKELRESYNNIKIIQHLNWCKKEDINPLLNEAHQLVSIFTASIKTAQNKSKINNHQS